MANDSPRIFISGASKGIGLATAVRFLEQGYQVAISASTTDSLAQVQAQYPQIKSFQADMSDKTQVNQLGEWLNAEFGRLDILVNNVGRFIPGELHKESDADFEAMLQTNLFSNYYLTKRVLPQMMAHKSGQIFNICSTASIMAYPNGGSYCISKFALLGFSKVLREEMKAHGIRVTSVIPGATYTASWEGSDLPEARFMPAADIATAIWEASQLSPRTVIEEILLRPQLGDLD